MDSTTIPLLQNAVVPPTGMNAYAVVDIEEAEKLVKPKSAFVFPAP